MMTQISFFVRIKMKKIAIIGVTTSAGRELLNMLERIARSARKFHMAKMWIWMYIISKILTLHRQKLPFS